MYRTLNIGRVQIIPKDIANFDSDLLALLKDKYEGRVDKVGIVVEIENIKSRSLGRISENALNGSVDCDVVYQCIAYDPKPGDAIFNAVITSVDDEGIFADKDKNFKVVIPTAEGILAREDLLKYKPGDTIDLDIIEISARIGSEECIIAGKIRNMETETSENTILLNRIFELDETAFESPIEISDPYIEFKDTPAPKLRVELGYHDKERFAKNMTENIDKRAWDFARSLANPYELLDTSKKYFDDKGKYFRSSFIDKFDGTHKPPISRAYHKIFEILSRFKMVPHTHHLISAHLAEGPGGFIEATVDYRKRLFPKYQKRDKYYGVTLRLEYKDEKPPGFGEDELGIEFLAENPNVIISYGTPKGSGDLTDPDIILGFQKQTKSKCQLVTADGGFSYTNVENIQEQLVDQLLFGEVVTALACSEKGANFVCKLYDVFTEPTERIMELTASYYEHFWFCKSETSRSANSERYLVAKGFKGISDKQLSYLLTILKKWREEVYYSGFDPRYPKKFVAKVIIPGDMNEQFRQFVKNTNTIMLTEQVNKLTEVIEIAHHRVPAYMKDQTSHEITIEKQKKYAKLWVERYYEPLLTKTKKKEESDSDSEKE